MKKFIIIKADYNGDYISEKTEITDEQLEKIKPVIEALKVRRKKLNEDRMKNWNQWRHNWDTTEYADCEPHKMYVETGILTEEQVELFNEFVPSVEYGVHTIESIDIVYEGEKLF